MLAFISSIVVFFLSLIIILLIRPISRVELSLSPKAILAAVAVGLAATGIEIFGVWAYSKGVELSIASYITADVPALTGTLLGLILLGETLTFYKLPRLEKPGFSC